MSPTKQAGTDPRLPTKAWAAKTPGGPLVPWDITRRNPRPHDVLVEIAYCGICHTDLHFVKNDLGLSVYPLVPGHEIVGKVKAVGSAVTKYQSGDTVGIGCLVDSCRDCDPCRRNLEQYCLNQATYTYSLPDRQGDGITYGGYSSQITCHEDFVLRVPGNLPLGKVAPLLCAGITTYSPLRRWNVNASHKVAVLGLGGLGHMAVKLAVSLGADVTVLSRTPAKEEKARALGARRFVVTGDEQQVKGAQGQFDFILDTVHAPHDVNAQLSMLRIGGTLIALGLATTPAPVAAPALIFGGRSYAGSLIGGLAETQEMLDYCGAKNITADVEIIAMKDVDQAYARLERGDVGHRFVIDMRTL